MFLISCSALSVAFVVLILSLLGSRDPQNTVLRTNQTMQIGVSLLLTGLFTFGLIGLFSPVSTIELAIGGALFAGLVVFYRMIGVKRRLAEYAASIKSGQVIVGDFPDNSSNNTPVTPFRKAA